MTSSTHTTSVWAPTICRGFPGSRDQPLHRKVIVPAEFWITSTNKFYRSANGVPTSGSWALFDACQRVGKLVIYQNCRRAELVVWTVRRYCWHAGPPTASPEGAGSRFNSRPSQICLEGSQFAKALQTLGEVIGIQERCEVSAKAPVGLLLPTNSRVGDARTIRSTWRFV